MDLCEIRGVALFIHVEGRVNGEVRVGMADLDDVDWSTDESTEVTTVTLLVPYKPCLTSATVTVNTCKSI
jgi:hypothetical protein